MVRYHRYHQWRNGDNKITTEQQNKQNSIAVMEFSGYYRTTTRTKLLSLLLLSFVCGCFVLASTLFTFPHSFGGESERLVTDFHVNHSLCSSIANGTVCCDRSSLRSDVCFMKGDIRTHSASSSVFLYTSTDHNEISGHVNHKVLEDEEELQHETIKPYTRKWETSVMNKIDELNLVLLIKNKNIKTRRHCDVHHDVPGVFFSTGGYTGNVYHEFNDGLLPLYITSQHLNKKVVFVILEYHNWWISKYGDILPLLSDYPPIDFNKDKRTHCFSESIVGLRIHDELTIDPLLMADGKSIKDFRKLLDQAFMPRINAIIQEEHEQLLQSPSSTSSLSPLDKVIGSKRPKLVIVSRKGSRAITNEETLAAMGEQIGFEVEVLRPQPRTELARVYRSLNSSDVMLGVHGAAMTHFLFMRPGTVFIQVVPLGTDWAAETYYGEPASKLGLKYIAYKILPKESSLYLKYGRTNPVLKDPDSVNKKGWEFTKKIYLDGQNVKLDLKRFRKRLVRAYAYSVLKKNQRLHLESR